MPHNLGYLRPSNLLLAIILIVIGVSILVGASSVNAKTIGGLVAGAGAGALLTELMSIQERVRASLEAERQKATMDRMEVTAIFGRFRTAAEYGALATQCLFGPNLPPPDATSRFDALSEALGVRSAASPIPLAGPDREIEGYALYKQIRQALQDRHGESVAAAFAFVYVGGIITGEGATADSKLANRLRNTLFDMPDEWLKVYVDRILSSWERGESSTPELKAQLENVNFWLMNYGSRRPEVLETEAALRSSAYQANRH